MQDTFITRPYSSHLLVADERSTLANWLALQAVCEPRSSDDATAVLTSSIVRDLAGWINATWAVAMMVRDGALLPVAVYGSQPHLGACLEHTRSLMAHESGDSDQPSISCEDLENRDGRPRIIATVKAGSETRGILAFGPKQGNPSYSEADRALIDGAASQISRLLGNEPLACLIGANLAWMHRLRLDLQAAREVQSRLFPARLPGIAGLDYYGECQVADEVGGDFFDFIPLAGRGLGLSVGDVSGHGVSSAIVMSGLQVLLRSLSMQGNGAISETVQRLNRSICQVAPEHLYASLFFAWIDPVRREMRYVNAGHEPALLVRKNTNIVHRFTSTGTVLGLTPETAYGQRAVALEPGDVLAVFTDGVTEAADSEHRELREEGVLQVIHRNAGARAVELVERIVDRVDRFTGGVRQTDDRTVAVVRFTGDLEFHGFGGQAACAAQFAA